MAVPAGWLSWAIVVLSLGIGLWLNALVLGKAGRSPWWALLFLVPLAWVVAVWAFAFAPWPAERRLIQPSGDGPPNPRDPH